MFEGNVTLSKIIKLKCLYFCGTNNLNILCQKNYKQNFYFSLVLLILLPGQRTIKRITSFKDIAIKTITSTFSAVQIL